jgi:hypothetical protein
MGAFIVKQKNGLLARYSTISDEFTDINMTESEYLDISIRRAIETAKRDTQDILTHDLVKYDDLNSIEKRKLTIALKRKERNPPAPVIRPVTVEDLEAVRQLVLSSWGNCNSTDHDRNITNGLNRACEMLEELKGRIKAQ